MSPLYTSLPSARDTSPSIYFFVNTVTVIAICAGALLECVWEETEWLLLATGAPWVSLAPCCRPAGGGASVPAKHKSSEISESSSGDALLSSLTP